MGYIEDNLVANEQILYQSRFHWWMWGQTCLPLTLGLLLLAGVLAILVNVSLGGLAVVASLVAALLLGAQPYLNWRFAEVGVTTRRVIIKRGIIVRDIFEMPMDEIENSQISETVLGRFLGYNRITLEDVDGPKRHFNLIRKGHDFHNRILEQISIGRTWREQYWQTAPTPQTDRNQRNAPPKYNLPSAPPVKPTTRTNPANQAQLIQQAIQLIQQNQRKQARDVLNQVLAQDERHADAWYLMGLTMAEPNRRRAAFVKALRYNPQHLQARQALTNWQ